MASRVFCVVIGVEVLLCELFSGIGGRCCSLGDVVITV